MYCILYKKLVEEKTLVNKIVVSNEDRTGKECEIIKWLKKEGDLVTRGSLIAKVKIKNSTYEISSDYEGTLIRVLYPIGTTVPIGTPVAWICTSGDKFTKINDSSQNNEDEYIRLTNIEKITAKRMFKSHTEVPVVTENTRVDVTELLSLRESMNKAFNTKISINDYVMFATAKALRIKPRMNSRFADDRLLYKSRINLGMAVTTPKGLLVPVIKDADKYTIAGFSEITKQLAAKCRNGKLQLDEMEGGTFTVSNLGMFGITAFTPIINQPEAGILGVCTIEDQLKRIDGKIVNRKIMGLSLTFDHRIVDGAEAAMFLETLKNLLEEPLTL